MKKIMSIFGTRPEAVKMAPIVLLLREYSGEFISRVVVTAQHRQMLDRVLDIFGIVPDHDLDVMRERQSLTDITVRTLTGLTPILEKERPDLVLVHGDTTTTLAASLAASYQRIAVGHVEAGLRSYDRDNPFPEEMNRVVADAVSILHFAPTGSARQNLLREGVAERGIHVTGNSGIDALHAALRRTDSLEYSDADPVSKLLRAGRYVLVTAHRRENFGQPISNICEALLSVAKRRPDVQIVYPVHPNPNVADVARSVLSSQQNVHLLPPLEYGDFVRLLRGALFVVTDSGGLQEEAPSLGKPVLVLRLVTERPEAVSAGTAMLIGTDRAAIVAAIDRLLDDPRSYATMATAVNPYGDGRAAQRTVDAIRYHFGILAERPAGFVEAKGQSGPPQEV